MKLLISLQDETMNCNEMFIPNKPTEWNRNDCYSNHPLNGCIKMSVTSEHPWENAQDEYPFNHENPSKPYEFFLLN